MCVPENIHTHPMESHWQFWVGGGSQKSKFLKESMKLNQKFLGGIQTKKASVGEVWIFKGTTQQYYCVSFLWFVDQDNSKWFHYSRLPWSLDTDHQVTVNDACCVCWSKLRKRGSSCTCGKLLWKFLLICVRQISQEWSQEKRGVSWLLFSFAHLLQKLVTVKMTLPLPLDKVFD